MGVFNIGLPASLHPLPTSLVNICTLTTGLFSTVFSDHVAFTVAELSKRLLLLLLSRNGVLSKLFVSYFLSDCVVLIISLSRHWELFDSHVVPLRCRGASAQPVQRGTQPAG